jgi:glyoxylase-like metal-dependent hydrolase (beta-lactamase superfamily II)
MLEMKIKIKSFTVGLFQTNMYILTNENHEAWLIDPACQTPAEQQAIQQYITREQLSVRAIIATHGHLDHLWGAAWATEQYQLPVLIDEADIPMAKAMQTQYDMFGMRTKAVDFPIQALNEQSLSLPSMTIIRTPGHTQGSVCLYHAQQGILLSGDTLFRCGYGRTDLPGGNTSQLFASLERLSTLPPTTQVFPGHGEYTTIGAERGY